jgi:hypothetical protein
MPAISANWSRCDRKLGVMKDGRSGNSAPRLQIESDQMGLAQGWSRKIRSDLHPGYTEAG